MATIDFGSQIAARLDGWIARRRDLHQHPELSFQEVRTAGIVASELTRLGLEVQTGVGKTGVVGLLEGNQDGPTVLIRADMDALPIHEENETEYASQTPNIMHACGHDGHTTIALAVAELLSERRAEIAGRVKFVFQPAEEVGLGASAMIADGVMNNPAPDLALGLHLWNETPVGTVALVDGPMMASAGDFMIRVQGRGGHGGLPHEAHDPVVAASQIVIALQTIVSRSLNPTDIGVVSVTMIRGGDTYNVIPSMVEMRGTFRTFRTEVRELIVQRMREISENVARAFGCTATIELRDLTLAVINSPQVNAQLRRVFAEIAPDVTLVDDCKTMAAEDMSYFLDAVPGTFFFVGSANPERGLDYPHHHPRFDFDEGAIPLGVRLLAAAAASYLIKV
jgi:amidohydrolase